MGLNFMLAAHNQSVQLRKTFLHEMFLQWEICNVFHDTFDKGIHMLSDNIFGAISWHFVFWEKIDLKRSSLNLGHLLNLNF